MKKNMLLLYLFDVVLLFGLGTVQLVSLLAGLFSVRYQVWFYILLVLTCGLVGLLMQFVVKDLSAANSEPKKDY